MNDAPVCIHVSTSDIGGGAEQAARSLHDAMNNSGWNSTLAVGWRYGDVERCAQIPNEQYSTLLSRLNRKWRVSQGHEIAPYPGTIHIPKLSPRPPDVMNLHNLHGNYFDLNMLPYLSKKYPTVLTVNDGWFLGGHCAHGIDCDRWLIGCGSCPHLDYMPAIPRDKTAQNWAAKRRIVKESSLHVIAVSQWMAQRFERAFGSSLASLQVIPNGIDEKMFYPRDKKEARKRFGIEQDAYVIGANYVGIDNPYKDPRGTREAILQRIAEQPNEKIVILCIGDAMMPDLPPSVALVKTGFVAQDDVAWALNCCDLFLHISKVETLPLAPIEAQMCGIPTIVNDAGGAPETISDTPHKDFGLNVVVKQYLELYDRIRTKP